jgi:glycosyltransferase involved in cell wall biosynthesis
VLFVTGPFPPPVHGMAVATERLAARAAQHFTVRRFDIAARERTGVRIIDLLLRMLQAIATLLGFMVLLPVRRPRAVVAALSAGFAQVFDLGAIAVAHTAGCRVYITHHSFAAFDGREPQRLLRLVLPLLRRCRHVVLCDLMKTRLCEGWTIDPHAVFVLSNAALIEAPPCVAQDPLGTGPARSAITTAGTVRQSGGLHVGFISNLCADKGLWTFLDIVEELRADGLEVQATIAGPVEPADADLERALRERLRRMSGVAWLGAVRGDDREAFYDSIDLLLFPTVYVHESEPLVILEALARGVEVVSTARGCIENALADGAAMLALPEDGFRAAAVAAISGRTDAPIDRRVRADRARRHFEGLQARGTAQFRRLIAAIDQG